MALDEEKLLIARTNDLYSKCDKYASAVFSTFLDPASQVIVNEKCINNVGYNSVWFGGYEDAERNVLGVFTEWEEPTDSAFPILALKIECKYPAGLSHRDYLGAILSLGIDRSKTGDIIVDGDSAVVFVLEDIAEYIKTNLAKIGRHGVKIDICSVDNIELPERKFKIINAVSASLRLDAVLAGGLNLSRANAVKLIQAGKVQINHKLCEDVSQNLSNGDLISVRGFGRLVFEGVGNSTRSGRIHITLKKFV